MVANAERKSPLTARNLSFVVLLLAILVSGYLSYLKISNESAVCLESGAFDCGVVLNSAYSELLGIPIAWLGLTTNIIVMSLLAFENRISLLRSMGPVFVFAIVLFAFLFSVYLVYVQAFILLTFCPWCLTHETLITILFILSGRRLSKHLKALENV